MESLVSVDPRFWNKRAVMITGHTGFKGSWLCSLLSDLGARIYGYALDPNTDPSLFRETGLAREMAGDVRADISELRSFQAATARAQPEIIFHMAAQPLVRESFRTPLATLQTNVIGTATVLEVTRLTPSVRVVVVITSDKVYKNLESNHRFVEDDALGGKDIYSASKAAADIITTSYRESFFQGTEPGVSIVSARSGNVIGGGDWAWERLVPDCVRAFEAGRPVVLRNPHAVRPWQHVLEPLAGYLMLAAQAWGQNSFPGAWNFGPPAESRATVEEIARRCAAEWGNRANVVTQTSDSAMPEASLLDLDSSRAISNLGWIPKWSVDEAITHTMSWYQTRRAGGDVRKAMRMQAMEYGILQ